MRRRLTGYRAVPMTRSVTLADVAKTAGVSLATASRALSGAAGRSVAADLKSRVLRAAADLHYSPNANAQAMAKGKSSTVGLVVHDISDPYAAAVASGVMAAAAERDLIVTVAATLWDPEAEIRHVEALRRQRARAVILAGSRFTDDRLSERLAHELAAIAASGGRAATIGQALPPTPALILDNVAGARRLATVLWTLGYRTFAVLSGPEALLTSEERTTGFRLGLADCGHALSDENIIATQLTRDGGYVAMTELLERELDVQAVFAVNDVMAVGAMAALREHGYQVPKDLALAGFDDILTLRDIQPPLTTVRLPLVQLGRRALQLALDAPLSHLGPINVTVPGEVVVRGSTPVRR